VFKQPKHPANYDLARGRSKNEAAASAAEMRKNQDKIETLRPIGTTELTTKQQPNIDSSEQKYNILNPYSSIELETKTLRSKHMFLQYDAYCLNCSTIRFTYVV